MHWFNKAMLAVLTLGAVTASAQQPVRPTAISPLEPKPASAAVSGEGASHLLTKADVDGWLDGYLPYALRAGDISGATVSIVKDGKLLTARGYGFADMAKRTPVDPARTLFRPGSVSKLVTWTAVMQQVERGKLDLDRDVNAYLDFRIPPYEGKPITLRQIMTHTTGFNEVSKDVIFLAPRPRRTLERYIKEALPKRIMAPGITPDYSNYATSLAAYLVQRVSGQDFDAYVEQHIFAPLGMKNSTFRQPLPARFAPDMAKGYRRGTEPPRPFEIVGPAAAGSLSSTATDMARFMLAHLQNGTLDGHAILKPETAQLMHAGPLGKINPQTLIPPLNRMRLGFFETNINGREVIGHLGDTDLFHTSLHLFMKDGVGLYVSFNSRGKDSAVGPLRSALFQDFADRYFPSAKKDGRVDPATSKRHAELMAGHWEFSRKSAGNFFAITNYLGQATISVGPKGELVVGSVVGPSGAPRRWVEIAPFVWKDMDGHERLAATIVDGRPVRWSFDLISPFMIYERAPASRSTAWITPGIIAGVAILLLSFLYWPVAWFIRRRYAAPLNLVGRSRGIYRATHLFSGLVLVILGGWAWVMASLSDQAQLSATFDAILWLLQIGGLLIFIGALLASGANIRFAFSDRRPWTHRVWAILILLATLMIFYFAWTYGLLAMTVAY